MKFIALIVIGCLTFLASTAYAINERYFSLKYLYIENPDPDNFEIVSDSASLSPNIVVNDERGHRACWIINEGIENPSLTIQHKISKIPVCKLNFNWGFPIIERSFYTISGLCSHILGKSYNTLWLSPSVKADWASAQAYQSWDCG